MDQPAEQPIALTDGRPRLEQGRGLGEPEIDHPGGDLLGVEGRGAGKQFGIESGPQHGGGFGRTGIPEDVEQRHRFQSFCALLGGAELAVGVSQHQVEFGGRGRARIFAELLFFPFGAAVENDDGDRRDNPQRQHYDHKSPIPCPVKRNQGSQAEAQKRGNQNYNDGKHVGEQDDLPNISLAAWN